MKELSLKEKNIVLSLTKGNKFAFRQVYDLYESRLYYFIFTITKSNYATEEILQEVFIKIWDIRETINVERSFGSLLYTIARNHTYNYLRKVANQESLKKELWNKIQLYNQQTDDNLVLSEYEKIVNDILMNIPKQKRKIYRLSRIEGKSNQEIADELDISTKTVKNHLWKTLQIIRSQLQPYLLDSTYGLLVSILFLEQ